MQRDKVLLFEFWALKKRETAVRDWRQDVDADDT